MIVYLLISLFFLNACQLEKGQERLVQLNTDTTTMEKKKIKLQLVQELPDISGEYIFWNSENSDWVILGNNQLFWGNKLELVAQITFMNYYGGDGEFDSESGIFKTFDREVSLEKGVIKVKNRTINPQKAATDEEVQLELFMENSLATTFFRDNEQDISLISYEHRPPAGWDEDLYKGPNNLLVLERGKSRQRQVIDQYTETLEITSLGQSANYYFAGNQNLLIWDKALNRISHELTPNFRSKIVSILHNDSHVFLLRANGTMEIVAMDDWSLVSTKVLFEDRPYSLSYNAELNMIIGTSRNKEVLFYRWKDQGIDLFETLDFARPVKLAKLSPDHEYLFVADEEKLSIYKISFDL